MFRRPQWLLGTITSPRDPMPERLRFVRHPSRRAPDDALEIDPLVSGESTPQSRNHHDCSIGRKLRKVSPEWTRVRYIAAIRQWVICLSRAKTRLPHSRRVRETKTFRLVCVDADIPGRRCNRFPPGDRAVSIKTAKARAMRLRSMVIESGRQKTGVPPYPPPLLLQNQ
jgi:hypothetical protein